MSEPRGETPPEKQDEPDNLHPGQHDEGGHGGMATRELEADRQVAQDD